jgi:undecaprenyl-diphosphatase
MNFILTDNFFKGGIVMAVCWFFWFHKSDQTDKDRKGIVVTIISSVIAIIVGRCLALTLPFRLRPAYDPAMLLVRPYKFGEYSIDNWSSFPSDHAVLFFALATGIFLISKKAGILTSLYVFFVILFPRLYFGLHYPTDALAGAAIGIIITYVVSRMKMFVPLVRRILEFSVKQPGYFYALFFLVSFEISTLFEEARDIGSYLFDAFRKAI